VLASGGGVERQSSQSGFSSKKVRILTKRHRQVLHSAKLKDIASAQSASAWYFSAILKAFCPPSLSPPQFFVFRFTKCAAKKEVMFASPARAHTTLNSHVKIKEKMYYNKISIQVRMILF